MRLPQIDLDAIALNKTGAVTRPPLFFCYL